MAQVEKTVFISYRRKDISWALAVYQYLTSQKYDVFFDYTSLQSGDFEEVIISNIRARAHFVLILTPTALDRCNEPGDWLRREIETAVDEKRNIIPMFFDGFNFSSPSISKTLTGKLAAINRYNGLEVPPGYFLEAMERLRTRYLNTPSSALIHPIPAQWQKVVRETQMAADEAVEAQRQDIEKLIKPAAEGTGLPTGAGGKDGAVRSSKRQMYAVSGSILAVLAVIILGTWAFRGDGGSTPEQPPSTEPPLITEAPEVAEPAVRITDTPVVTELPISASPEPVPTIGSTLTSEYDGMVLVYVPEGEFKMGSETGDIDEKKIHTVYLDSFWIDRTEVTNAMYQECVKKGQCKEPSFVKSHTQNFYYGNPKYDQYPVIYVTWEDAKTYCSWVQRRLPTEAEWEKAASQLNEVKQQNYRYPWGEPIDCNYANYFQTAKTVCKGDTYVVGSYPMGASLYGALDMAGNVWEWVQDRYGLSYYNDSPAANPPGPEDGKERVFRGGAWNSGAYDLRSANRGYAKPETPRDDLGFRCAQDATP